MEVPSVHSTYKVKTEFKIHCLSYWDICQWYCIYLEVIFRHEFLSYEYYTVIRLNEWNWCSRGIVIRNMVSYCGDEYY